MAGLGVFLQAPNAMASEADLILPDLHSVSFLGGIPGYTLLMWGLAICLFGMIFGVVQYTGIRKLPAHKAMLEISELIYETCKTYLITQGKFILVLWALIGAIIIAYFGWLRHLEVIKVVFILIASLIGILGSYIVAWFGMRINTFANSRTAFASLGGKPFPTYAIPL
ncbi:MAG: sodium-translocating pyrophosphatase, partial [Chlorobiales bacterium]|nr:sodium-translocating pyrophosphatase [Chlorobiales bacterium]